MTFWSAVAPAGYAWLARRGLAAVQRAVRDAADVHAFADVVQQIHEQTDASAVELLGLNIAGWGSRDNRDAASSPAGHCL